MFDYLYAKQYAIQRQRDGLFAQERERYLQHCHSTGSTRVTLQVKGQALLRFANHMRISDRNGMDRQRFDEIVGLVTESNPSPGAIYGVKKCSQPWLRFLGWLVEPENPKFFIEELESYVSWMRDERGLSSSTIEQWTERLTSFLCWYGGRGKKFSQINIHDIDAYFVEMGKNWGRTSSAYIVTMLRVFLRHAASTGKCDARLPTLIDRPRIYRDEGLPSALEWPDVQRLLANADSGASNDIRDRAIMMLMAIYGLRTCEVASLRLDQIDRKNSTLLIQRAKNRRPQIYPLIGSVADALDQYISTVRPAVECPEVFIRFAAPLSPISRAGLSTAVHRRIKELGVSIKRSGPHSLRHACAVRLLSEGFNLNEIGDHLGHQSASATRVYAKTDVRALREVAAFDLGDLS